MSDLFTAFKNLNVGDIYNATMEELDAINRTVMNNLELVRNTIRWGGGGRSVDHYQRDAE